VSPVASITHTPDVASKQEIGELALVVKRRREAGAAPEDIARWLYAGPAAGRAILAIKALMIGCELRLAECKRLVDGAIAEIEPDYFERLVALREEAAGVFGRPDEFE
jgi:hypothetical protein